MAGENFGELMASRVWWGKTLANCNELSFSSQAEIQHAKLKNHNHLFYRHVHYKNRLRYENGARVCLIKCSERIPQIQRCIWSAPIDGTELSCEREPGNARDTSAVAVIERSPSGAELTVGHVP